MAGKILLRTGLDRLVPHFEISAQMTSLSATILFPFDPEDVAFGTEAFLRQGRPTSNSIRHHQAGEHDDGERERSAGAVPPASAVPPSRQGGNQQRDEN
jgi:hypothetical protein